MTSTIPLFFQNNPLIYKIKDAEISYFPDFFSQTKASNLLETLIKKIEWRQNTIKMYGKENPVPRLEAWYGDPGKSYAYSGIHMEPNPWTDELREIKQSIEVESGISFNSVLINYYRDGQDRVAWHSDDEKELGKNPVIGSVSFGAERTFKLRHKQYKENNLKQSIVLKNGSFLRNYLEITSGDGMNNFTKDYGGLKYGGRIDFLPFGLFTNMGQFRQADVMRERSLKLVVGFNYSFNNGISSRRGREGGQILYLDSLGNESLPDFIKMGADLMLKYKGFSLLGEYQSTTSIVPDNITQRVRNNGTTSPSFIINGEENIENYINNRMMLGSAYNLQLGYMFKNMFSLDARYTHIESDEFSFLNNGTFYNRPNYYTFGLSKYFARNYGFKIQAALTYVEVDDNSTYPQQTGDMNEPYQNIPYQGSEFLFRLISSFNF